jgi:hypothetical protein|tara:strand:+ start:31 stop:429 length:399 start_codon:yes stop_codon:yes gene_type:complete
MKKIILIFVLALTFYINPSMVENSKANSKNPKEKCVDLVLDHLKNDNVVEASEICVGVNKYTLKCMNKYFKMIGSPVRNPVREVEICSGASWGTSICTFFFEGTYRLPGHISRLCADKDLNFMKLIQIYFFT